MGSKAKSYLLNAITILMSLFIIVLVLEIALRFLPVFSGMPVNKLSEIYSFIPHSAIQRSMHWNLSDARIRQVNNVGFISDQAYIPAAQMIDSNRSGKPLVAIIGDSYIEAMHVDYIHTAEANLLRNCSDHARFYSFGAQFAPLSQYLSWVSYVSQTFSPKVMVVNIVGNDFDESLIHHQNSLNHGGVPGMQFFDFSSGRAEIVTIPFIQDGILKRILRHSALAQYLVRNVGVINLMNEYRKRNSDEFEDNHDQLENKQKKAGIESARPIRKKPKEYVGNTERSYTAERLSLSKKVVDEFLRRLPHLAQLQPQSIVLSVDAERPQIYTSSGRQDLDSFFSVMRAYLIKQARSQGFVVLDLRPAMISQFDQTGERFEFINDNHWNSAGHQLLANQLLLSPPISKLCQ